MRNVFITTIAALAIAGAAQAEDTVTKTQTPVMGPVLSGELSLDFAETTNNNYGGTFGLDLGIDVQGLATVDLDFEVDEAGNGSLADWTVGTTVGGLGVAAGTDNGVMPGAEGEQTLAAPVMTESVAVTAGGASVALGFTDWNTDITDISNVQGAYTMGVAGIDVTAAADYNMDSENTVLGAGVSGLDLGVAALGGAMTYDMDAEVFGFEAVATTGGLTAYLNGDDTNRLQNIGGEYTMDVNGATIAAGANYDTDTKDLTPTLGLSFNF
jgi:hypothetical protein